MEDAKQSNVATKIADIMADLPAIEKSAVRFGNVSYKAYGIDQMTGLLRKKMGDSNLVVTSQITDVININNINFVKFIFTLIDGDSGDEKICPWMQPMSSGNGIDKAMGATISYAYKNFLMKTFMISPEGEPDPDFDEEFQDGNTSSNKPAQQQPQSTPPPPKNDARAALDGKEVECYLIKPDKQLGRKPRWKALVNFDGDTKIPVTLYPEHLIEIDKALGFEEGAIQKIISDKGEINFSASLLIVPYLDKKWGLKFKSVPIELHNPAVEYRFKHNNDHVPGAMLLKALKVDKLSDYNADIYTAQKELDDYLRKQEEDATEEARIQSEIEAQNDDGSRSSVYSKQTILPLPTSQADYKAN